MPDKRGWWPHGWSKIETVRKSVRNYLAKFLSKLGRGDFPKGCRLCGRGGLPAPARAWARWQCKPGYMRRECDPCDAPRRVRGGHDFAGDTPLPTP